MLPLQITFALYSPPDAHLFFSPLALELVLLGPNTPSATDNRWAMAVAAWLWAAVVAYAVFFVAHLAARLIYVLAKRRRLKYDCPEEKKNKNKKQEEEEEEE